MQYTGLRFDIRQCQADQLATAQSGRVQENDCQPHDRGQQRGVRVGWQLVGNDQHRRHLLRGNDHRPAVRNGTDEGNRIRHETTRFRSPAIGAELVHCQLPPSPRRRGQVPERFAPVLEAGLVEVDGVCSGEVTAKMVENPFRFDIATAERALMGQPSLDPAFQWSELKTWQPPLLVASVGTGSATVRNMSVSTRR